MKKLAITCLAIMGSIFAFVIVGTSVMGLFNHYDLRCFELEDEDEPRTVTKLTEVTSDCKSGNEVWIDVHGLTKQSLDNELKEYPWQQGLEPRMQKKVVFLNGTTLDY
jgi:hypothetical protein